MSMILLVDDIKAVREQFAYDLQRKSGFEVITAENGSIALGLLQEYDIDVVILDIEMPVMDGLEMLQRMVAEGCDDVPVIVYTARGNFERCVKAVQLGAYNFFDKQEVTLDQLIIAVQNALEYRTLKRENRALRKAAGQDSPIIGTSSVTQSLRQEIVNLATVPSNVLVVGESGTGKELVAREIHRLSHRTNKPFIAVNCAAMPENLVESELFGFEKGAFSGAIRTSRGKFEIASGGTLFLDEIGDMPLSVQPKLLRVLQENEFTRLGGESRVIHVDVRVVAATHQDLESAISAGAFRRDLYFRICTHVINVPPLRERIDDIGPLVVFFIKRICERFGINRKQIAADAISCLQAYDWHRNNVRELENIVERMIIQCASVELLPEHVPAEILDSANPSTPVSGKTLQQLKQEAERRILLQALQSHEWHITRTAQTLGIANHSNLLKMMRRLGIVRPDK